MYDVACRYDAGYTYEQDWDQQISSTTSRRMTDETANERCAIEPFSDFVIHLRTARRAPADRR